MNDNNIRIYDKYWKANRYSWGELLGMDFQKC